MQNLRAALLDELKGVLNKKNPDKIEVAKQIKPINTVSRSYTVPKKPIQSTESDFEIFFGEKLLDYHSILPKNKRRVYLRNKYNCILYSDVKYLKGIISQVRKWFYKHPTVFDDKIIFGGIYIDYLQPRAHKTDKLYLVNFRCESDLQLVDKVKSIANSYGLQCKIDYTLY